MMMMAALSRSKTRRKIMTEVIGEFTFFNGEWWERDFYYSSNRWVWIAGAYHLY
jgi:hypothetical protein